MEDKLIYSPRTKQQIKDVLYGFLYDPVLKHFKSRIDSIILKNSTLLKSDHTSFVYKGVLYSCNTTKLPRKLNKLLTPLHSMMEEYLNDVMQLNSHELPYVVGFINQVLNSSSDLHDYLRILPSSMHLPIERLIATCPCSVTKLSSTDVKALQDKNKSAITMMKQRLLTNLLI